MVEKIILDTEQARRKQRNKRLKFKTSYGFLEIDPKQSASLAEYVKENTKSVCGEGGLWLTSGGRIVIDDHNCETFFPPYDKLLFTKKELSNGIKFKDFFIRLIDTNPRIRQVLD